MQRPLKTAKEADFGESSPFRYLKQTILVSLTQSSNNTNAICNFQRQIRTSFLPMVDCMRQVCRKC